MTRRADTVVPTLATLTIAKKMVAAARKDGTPEAILEHLPKIHPDQQLALLAYIVKLAATAPTIAPKRVSRAIQREQLAREDAAYTIEEARHAHAAWASGRRDDWTITGSRVYKRRAMRAQRERARGEAS